MPVTVQVQSRANDWPFISIETIENKTAALWKVGQVDRKSTITFSIGLYVFLRLDTSGCLNDRKSPSLSLAAWTGFHKKLDVLLANVGRSHG